MTKIKLEDGPQDGLTIQVPGKEEIGMRLYVGGNLYVQTDRWDDLWRVYEHGQISVAGRFLGE